MFRENGQTDPIKRIVALFLLTVCLMAGALGGGFEIRAASAASSAQSDEAAAAEPEFHTFDELSGKTVSMITGAPFEEPVRERVPDVGGFSFFNNTPDMLLSLRSGKTDAALANSATAALALSRDETLTLFPEPLQEMSAGFAFAKGDPQRDVWQAALEKIPEDAIHAAWEKWTGADESAKVLPEQDWPGANGTVEVAACDTLEPMSYAGEGGELRGFDIEVILLMAKELDVHVSFTGMEFSSVLSYVQAGKALFGAGSIFITEERQETMDFVDYYPMSFVLIVRKASAAGGGKSFIASVRESFHKTFIRENRYQLFLSGIGTTLLIVVMSAAFGTVLGFLIFLACRRGNRVANALARAFSWLISGMPVVVLLMILYYIIFGKVSISGTWISIVGFTLVFGAEVLGLMKSAVGAVDAGQQEAALALGYSDRRAFFRHILPQAMPHFMPGYRSGLVSLIKGTAIVGYVAVQDLTKMGDIVRSRTYEAFFPLIAVAVIYFLLAAILIFAVDRLARRFDPTLRSKGEILKGLDMRGNL